MQQRFAGPLRWSHDSCDSHAAVVQIAGKYMTIRGLSFLANCPLQQVCAVIVSASLLRITD